MTHELYATKVSEYIERRDSQTGIVLSANEWRKYKSNGSIFGSNFVDPSPLDKILSFILLTYPGYLDHLRNHFQSEKPLEQTIFRTDNSTKFNALSIYEIFFQIKKDLEADLQSIKNEVNAVNHANKEFYTTQKAAILKAKEEDVKASLDQLQKNIIEFSRQENKEHNNLTKITDGDLREFGKTIRSQNSESKEEKDRWISNKRSVQFHTWAYSILRSFISAAGTWTLFGAIFTIFFGWNLSSILTVALITSIAFLTSVYSHWELARDNSRKHLKTQGFFAFISKQNFLQKLLTIGIIVGVMSIYTFPFFQNVMKLSILGGPYEMYYWMAFGGTLLIGYEVFLIFSKQVAEFLEKLTWKNFKDFFDEELKQPFNAGKSKIVFGNLSRMILTMGCIVIGNMVTFGGLTSAISFTTNLLMPFLSTTAKASIAWIAKILVGVFNSIGSFIFSGKKLYNALGNVIAPKDEKIEEFNRAANFGHSKEIPADNPEKKIAVHSDSSMVTSWRIVDGVLRATSAFFSNVAFKALEFANGFDAHTLQTPNPVAHPILGPSCSGVISAFNKISGTVPPDLHRGATPPKSTYGELKELGRSNSSINLPLPLDDSKASDTPPSSHSPDSHTVNRIDGSFELDGTPSNGKNTPTQEVVPLLQNTEEYSSPPVVN